MASKTETDTFINKGKNSSTEPKKCCSVWWNQGYHSQEVITRTIESFYFHGLIIFLVIVDTSLVVTEIILDSFKNQFECQNHVHHSLSHHNELMIERLEFAMEIAHYSSIGILTFFVIELIVKIYALGKEFWNIRKKKMEYFDAFIVITSFAVDIYLLGGEKKIFGEKLLLILSFRLWRFIRIISSVTEVTVHGQTKHKQHLNHQYLAAVNRLVDLIKHKTTHIETSNENLDFTLEYFRMIDIRCQVSLDKLDKNHELTSSILVTQFLEELDGVEDKNKNSAITSIFIKPPDEFVRSSDV